MTLALVSVNATGFAVPARLSHDMRNTLATLSLHIESLERLSGQSGAKATSAAHALISKAVGICTEVLEDAANPGAPARRINVDVVTVIRQLIDLLQPISPEALVITVNTTAPVIVLGSGGEVFRILFNLAHNAVMVARRTRCLTHLQFVVERAAATVVIQIVDNGPGLPKDVRKRLFRSAGDNNSGFGLAIARELAERNGGTLDYSGENGATFTLVLPAPATVAAKESPVTRMLGRSSIRV